MKKIFIFVLFLISTPGLFAQDLINNTSSPATIEKNYIVKTFLIRNGKSIDEVIVPGKPPDKYRAPVAIPTETTAILTNVPGYDWSFGCSATSAAMISGYYDNNNYPNMYNGPTNNGVAPMNNSIWGTVIINGETRSQCPLSATRQGVDGRAIRGHVDDYWIQYGNCDNDPFIQNGWIEHTAGECTGDYMGTNQSDVQNCDGSTVFFFYTDGSPLYDYTGQEPNLRDGCHGLRLYFESRGYTLIQNYSQYIYGYNGNTSGFTFNQYKQEIDAGRPVLIQVSGHTMIGYGYDNPNIVYIHDTWDYSPHTMTWGGSYSGLQHYGVSVFELVPIPNQIPTISITFPNNGDDFTQPDILVTGNASDPDGSVNEVLVRLNSGNWETANGSNNWSFQVTLEQGSNLIEARAIDNIGATSDIVSVTVTYTPNSAPTLTWTGETGYEADGVSPDEGNSTLTFTFRVKYTDIDGDAPQTGYPKLYLNKSGNPVSGSPFTMMEGNTEPFATGRIYTFEKNNLETGTDYAYHFEAKDINNNLATGEATIEQSGPIVINLMSSIIVTQPSVDIIISQGDSVLIEWNTTNAVGGATVNLFLDIDSIWANDNEIPLEFFLPLNGSLYWQTSGVLPGHYFIVGLLSDGIENPYDYAGGTVTIIQTFQLSVSVSNGWNMVSVPGNNPDGQDVSDWWINHIGNVYKYVPGAAYTGITTTTPGEGYWMKNAGAQTYNTGDEWPAGGITIVAHIPISVETKWNMFGGYEDIVDAAALTTTPPDKIVYPVYKYVPGFSYQPAAQIVPGYAYWVKVSAACQINLPDDKAGIPDALAKANQNLPDGKAGWGKIIITDASGSSYTLYAVSENSPNGGAGVNLDKYEMPPLPPAGIFDVRYGSGRIVEDINSAAQSIEMRGITYPVKVKVENVDVRLQDLSGKEINTNVKTGEEITISNPGINKVMVSCNLIPDKFALEQNYPNPFNPGTTIRWRLPEGRDATLKVYDILGREIVILVDEYRPAGKYETEFNASSLPSGIYFYRIQAGSFIDTKKMILLK